MILLELEFEESLETIIEKFKIHGRTHEGPEISLSQQVLLPKHRAGEEMRTDYGRMVRICLDCDFGLGLHKYSLGDEQWQRAFYLQLVCQFTTFCLSRKRVLDGRSMGCRVSTLGILTTGRRTSKNPATLPFQASAQPPLTLLIRYLTLRTGFPAPEKEIRVAMAAAIDLDVAVEIATAAPQDMVEAHQAYV